MSGAFARSFAVLAFVAASACTEPARSHAQPDQRYAGVAASLERLIRHEIDDKDLASITIALVDGQDIVWARGFGFANPTDSTPATDSTVFRVGSVSKLFTDIAIMQLVERGEIDLDSPVTTYLPSFRPNNVFGEPITLRMLMSHRAGLMREPPVGNYFDPDGSTLAAMVESLNGRDLVYEPGTRTKYSNAGIGAVGYVLETVKGEPFAPLLKRTVLEPMGLDHSAFEPLPAISASLATGFMWTPDGRTFEAPTFELGMTPAGSMYSTVVDLGRFISVLFNDGVSAGGRILADSTIDRMWTPQFQSPANAGPFSGFGLGFALGSLDGHRRVGHGGAIYGFATELAALPDDELGAVVVVTLDVANSVAERIADAALRLMLAAKAGQALPGIPRAAAVGGERAAAIEGRYTAARGEDLDHARRVGLRGDEGVPFVDLLHRGEDLLLDNGERYSLRAFGDTLIIDDRRAHGTRILPIDGERIVISGDTMARVPVAKPRAAPARFAGLIGEYGWDHDVLYIYERGGRLHGLIEWFFDYPLAEVGSDVFAFPARGLYDGEHLAFTRGDGGTATQVEAAGVVFRRRDVGTEAGATFRITPLQPVEALRRAALGAQPPVEAGDRLEPDLVELRDLDGTIRYDIRYATTNNFMGAQFYTEPHAFMQRPAAEAVVRAHRRLREQGYGLLIHDAYRPWYVTKMFWDATPQEMKQFVADPANGSRHNRGAAVDLTLFDLATGRPVPMVSGYDEFSPRAFPDYPGGASIERWHRELLRDAMEAEGFDVYEWEWWHFDFRDWRRYSLGNQTFDRIGH